jgi:transcriptional regulator with XRE-family HTH domain
MKRYDLSPQTLNWEMTVRGGRPVGEQDLAVGRRLAAIRSEVGLSQAEAARRLGFAQSRIAKLETGTRRLLFSDAVAITGLYGVALSALVADSVVHRGLGATADSAHGNPTVEDDDADGPVSLRS